MIMELTMTTNKDYIFLRALKKEPLERTPVWIMRQAGRYLPEYRALRIKAKNFLNLCKTPELACEATLQPLERFDLDAAIIFSDILTIPDAMGLGLTFIEHEGPQFTNPIQSSKDIFNLPHLVPEQDLDYVLHLIKLLKKSLSNRVPLIGFAGSPWTLATYMVEGKVTKNFSKIRTMLYKDRTNLHALLLHLGLQVEKYLLAQIQAGVDVIMLFDTWGGLLSEQLYLEFSLQYIKKIISKVKNCFKNIPVIIFTKNSGQFIQQVAHTGCDCIGLDWTANLALARKTVGHQVALQGNLDPCVLYAPKKVIEQEVKLMLKQYGQGSGHIFNLGHGIYPDVDPEHVQFMVKAVKMFSPVFHNSHE